MFEGLDYHTSITRVKFEELCDDLFRSITIPLDRVIADAKTDKSKVQEIVLVGGSTRIPRVQSILTDYFDRPPNRSINPDNAACNGAAWMASILSGDQSTNISDKFLLVDVQQLTLGIETRGGLMTKIITRNTSIPTKATGKFAASLSGADFTGESLPVCEIPIKVYCGERIRVKDNFMIGIINMTGNSFEPRRLEVFFDIDARHKLNIWAQWTDGKPPGQKFFLEDHTLHQIPEAELLRMKDVAGHFLKEDKKEEARITAKNALESKLYSLKSMINEPEISLLLDFSERKNIEATIDNQLAWLDEDQRNAAEEYHSRRKLLENIVHRLQSLKENTATDLISFPESPSSHGDSVNLQTPFFDPTEVRAEIPNPEQRLAKFFSVDANSRAAYTHLELQEVSKILQDLGHLEWSKVPKLYTVLRLIGQLHLLDSYIDEGITDSWFPFQRVNIPGGLAPSVRSAFEKAQSLVPSVSAPVDEPGASGKVERDFVTFDEQSPPDGA